MRRGRSFIVGQYTKIVPEKERDPADFLHRAVAVLSFRARLLGEEHLPHHGLGAGLQLVEVDPPGRNNINHLARRQVLSTQAWHHLALVRRGREVGLYLDGRLDQLGKLPPRNPG